MKVSLLRLRHVLAVTGLPRSTLYSYIAENNFPKPVQLGPRAVAWRVWKSEFPKTGIRLRG